MRLVGNFNKPFIWLLYTERTGWIKNGFVLIRISEIKVYLAKQVLFLFCIWFIFYFISDAGSISLGFLEKWQLLILVCNRVPWRSNDRLLCLLFCIFMTQNQPTHREDIFTGSNWAAARSGWRWPYSQARWWLKCTIWLQS